MKVLCFTNMYPTAAEPWFGSFVSALVDDVRALGTDVEVLAFDGRKRNREYADALVTLRRTLHRGRFDLLHAHYGLTGAVALGQRRVPTIVTFHGSDTGYPPVMWQAYISWVVARLATPVFVSRDGARRLGCPNATVIPAGVDVDVFHPRPMVESRRSLGWSAHDRIVLFPGARGNPRKNAPLFDLVMSELRQRMPDLKAVSLEAFSRAEVVDVMNAVDVTLMTSFFEGSPVAAKESLSCMTPVVSVPVGDMPELLAGLPGCAIAPPSPSALADAVVVALDSGRDIALRQRAERFSGRRVAERTIALYQSVTAERAA